MNHEVNTRNEDYLDKLFMGTVEEPNDPRREGRCRIRVFGIHEDIEVEDLPWAYPAQKSTFFGQDGKAGSLSVPKKGSVVTVKFNNGNLYSPEYYSIHELEDTAREELEKDGEYLGSHIVLFDGDEEIKIWFTVNKGLTMQLKGSRINIRQDRGIEIEHAGTSSSIELSGGDINIQSQSTVNVTSGAEVVLTSNLVHVAGNQTIVGEGDLSPQKAVLGEPLFACLYQLAALIDAKVPTSAGAATGFVKTAEVAALSNTVVIHK
jgi:hypothetical protein